MDRFFEKISYEQFYKDVKLGEDIYNQYILPIRGTKNSAGYDFMAIYDFEIKSGEVKRIPLGVKAFMQSDEFLMIVSRSSMGFKHNIRLTNQVGVIDSDYFNNKDNEGHIWISIQNHSDVDVFIKKGDKIVQGIFVKYLTVDNEKPIDSERISGIGSTNKEEDNYE